ncbi:MAG: GDSL-type esterase/lipase family protein [Emergencia sp.]
MRSRKEQRKFMIFIAVLLILAGLFFINFFKSNDSADYSSTRIRANLSAIATFDYSQVTTVEKQIKALETAQAKGTFDVTRVLTKDQYRKILSTSVVLGDSITEGLTAYGWLDDGQVFCKIGASIINGDDIFESASLVYPRIAFLAFGMNDMGNYNGDADRFTAKYKELILKFQETSPETVILVNSITPPSSEALENKPVLKNYKKFNRSLKAMCKDLGLTFIDNSYIIEDHPEFYAGDGIHVTSDYYPYWMNNMILKAGL